MDLARYGIFRQLSEDEAEVYRLWAIDNYEPGSPISPMWHPVVRRECGQINRRNKTGSDGEDSNGGGSGAEAPNEKA